MTTSLRIGTRRSRLALWQAEWVAEELRGSGASVELVEITTSGDDQNMGPIPAIGLQGVFTKEIQSAVLDGQVDIAVHSLKDLPTEMIAGLALAAVPPRENVADALVTDRAESLSTLPPQSRVGTGSQRRKAQLLHLRPDLEIVNIRGNVDTRLRKLDNGEYDAVILAAAGLRRLGLDSRIVKLLSPPQMLPAVGQGALGIECRADNTSVCDLLRRLDHDDTRAAILAERAMLALLHGGCSAPVGAWGRIESGRLVLDGLVASLDGTRIVRGSAHEPKQAAESVGREVARHLLDQGAAEIIEAARGSY